MVPSAMETISSLSLDEAVTPTFPSSLDNHRQFQELLRSVVEQLQISLEEVQDLQHKFLGILHLQALVGLLTR